jgi:hypothetical protein
LIGEWTERVADGDTPSFRILYNKKDSDEKRENEYRANLRHATS